jgi:hypothetical protein
MQMSIKTLEWQKASLEALRAGAEAAVQASAPPQPKPHGPAKKSKPKETGE